MPFQKYLLILILLANFLIPGPGEAGDKITWLVTHWPPIMILDESNKSVVGGSEGERLKVLQANLPDYKHVNLEMVWNRFWIDVARGGPFLNSMALKTPEREQFAEFSIPVSIYLPNHIILHEDVAEKLGNPDSLSLKEIISDNRFYGLLIENRSYGKEIDSILNVHEGKSNIHRKIYSGEQYLKMLINKRIDFTLEYPQVLSYSLAQYQLDGSSLKTIPIREVEPFYYVYVACSKNEWGKAVIKDINKVVRVLRETESYRNVVMLMYEGETLKRILDYYDRFFIFAEE